MNKPNRPWVIFIIIFFTFACTLPGVSTPSEFPTPDSNFLSTVIAGTANAAAMQTAQAGSTAGIPLPVSTETAAPAVTLTATPQLTFSAYDTAIQQQADGSTLFIDKKTNYQLVIPAGWTAFRINEPEFYKIWELPASNNEVVRSNLTSIQTMDPNTFRLFAFDLRDGHYQNDNLTNIDISWSQTINTYNDDISGLQKAYSKIFTSNKLLTSKVETNSSNVEFDVAELDIKSKAIEVYEKLIILKAKPGVVTIRFDTLYSLKDTIAPDIDQLKESIQLVSQ